MMFKKKILSLNQKAERKILDWSISGRKETPAPLLSIAGVFCFQRFCLLFEFNQLFSKASSGSISIIERKPELKLGSFDTAQYAEQVNVPL